MTPAEQFKWLVHNMLAESEATYGNDESKGARRMFGSTSIKTGGKMFAFLNRKTNSLVVKLPEARVNEFVEAGKGARFDPGDGRVQREWVVVNSSSADDWHALAREAEAYVGKR